jgi:hypothetical protein
VNEEKPENIAVRRVDSEAPSAASDEAVAAAPAPREADAAALPERYDVDEVVAVAVNPRTLYVYWEVRPRTLAHARVRDAGGHLVVRVVVVAATWDGPRSVLHEVSVDELFGDCFVRDATPGANVRVSIGWRTNEVFSPFAVGMELTMPRGDVAEPLAREVAQWSSPFEAADAAWSGAPGGRRPPRLGLGRDADVSRSGAAPALGRGGGRGERVGGWVASAAVDGALLEAASPATSAAFWVAVPPHVQGGGSELASSP